MSALASAVDPFGLFTDRASRVTLDERRAFNRDSTNGIVEDWIALHSADAWDAVSSGAEVHVVKHLRDLRQRIATAGLDERYVEALARRIAPDALDERTADW